MKKKILRILTVLVLLMNLIPWAKVIAAPSVTSVSPSNNQTVNVGNDAIYKITIQNTCSQSDIFNVTSSPTNQHWTVSLFKSDNSTPLSDTNGDGIVDTGSVASGGNVDIYVHVKPDYAVCNNSQYVLTLTFTSTNGNCGGSVNATITTTAIHRGNLVITKEVSPTEAKVGDTVTWTIHIKNTGQDPIDNVHITDTLGSGISNPSNFVYNPQPVGSFPNWVYNEIPAGSDYTISFQTQVSGCSNADNTIDAWWGIDEDNKCQTQHALQSVKIIPTVPYIQITVPNISVPYCGSTDVTIPIKNNGDGVAKGFKLKIDKIPSGYQISNIGVNWSYDSNTGEFTYLGGSPQGTIAPNETVNLTFTISMPQGACTLPSSTLKYFAEYYDPCDNLFVNPSQLGSISVTGNGAYFTITKSGPDPVDIGQTNKTYTISVTYHKGNCSNDTATVDIIDTLPTPFIPQSSSNGGAINGQEVKWDNITLQDGVTQNFTITFNVTADPCYAGAEYTNTVKLTGPNGETLTDCCGCPIQNPSASFSTYVNDPSNAITDSSKTANPLPIEVDCSTDTGSYTNPSGNSDSHNDRRYTVEYDFNTGTNAPSSWSGIIFEDQLNNNQYTSSSIANIEIQVECGSGFQTVTGWSVISYQPTLKIDLSGLQTCAPNTGAKLKISFTARATQTNDSNNSSVDYDYIDWSTLEIPGFPRGCSNDPKYYEGVRVTDYRANLTLSTSLPQIVEKCATYNLTINFTRENANVDHADLTLTFNGFTYVSGSTTYSNGGSWCSGTKGEPTVNGNTLTWSSDQINEISSNGSITIQIKKDCSDNASVTVSSNYLDNCGKSHSASASASSTLVKQAVLYTKVTPQLNFAYAHTVDWKVYVSNGGDGTAREIILTTTLGSGLKFNSNGAYIKIGSTTYNYGDSAITWPSNGSTGTLTWNLGNLTIDPSTKIEVYFKTDVNSCDENNLTVQAYSSWCNCQTSNTDTGRVSLPTSYALVTINSADIYLCGNGTVEVSIKNPGVTHIYNVVSHTYLPKYINYKANSAQYSYNGGTYQVAGNPTETQITSGNYAGGWELVFNSSNIPNFGDLAPGDEIKIKFGVETDTNYQYPSCNFFKGTFKKIKSFANFAKLCDVTNISETSNIYERDFTTFAPNLSITKNVVEIDGHSVSPTPWFPRELGKSVVFEINITNNGNLSTVRTNFGDVFKAPLRHPLVVNSAQYSYDGSTYQNVPWDISDGGEPNNSVYIWNNIESDLGHGIEPGKTLTLKITAKIDSNCTVYNAHEISEVWTGCSDLTDMTVSNLLQWNDTSIWNSWNGSLTSDCPIYQAKYARVASHIDSWALTYLNNIPDKIHACDQNVQFEIGFKNGEVYEGATTIYGPITLYDILPRGATYVSGSTEFLLPGSGTWVPGNDPDISTIDWTTSNNPNWNGTFKKLEWNSTNNLTLGLVNIQPTQEIHVRFKVNFDCSVQDRDINRQRLSGHDCSGNYTYYFPAGNEQYLDWWEKDHWEYSPDHPWIWEIDFLKPNIQITKTVDKDNATPGDSLLYKINIKNTGDGSARNFSLQDPVPSGLIIDTNSITDGPPPGTGTTITGMTHSVNGNTIEWRISNPPDDAFPAGAETTLSFRVLVSNTASGTICNSPLILNSECCYQNYQIPTNACTKITATPIKVTKSIVEVNYQPAQEPVRLQPGDIVKFRIKVENKGSLPVYNVDVYDTLPTGFVYILNSSRYQRTNGSVPTTWISAGNPNTSPYQTPPPTPPGFSGYQWHIQQTLEGTDDNGGTTGSSLDTLYLEFLAKVTTNAPASPIGSYAVNVGDVSCTTDMQGNTPIDRSVIDTSDAKAWSLVYKPQLQIYKSVYSINGNTLNTTRVQPNDIVRYKIQVKNTSGYGLAIAVVTTDTLPPGFYYIYQTTSATWTGGSSTSDPIVVGNQLTFSFNNQAQIAPGDSLVIYYSVRVTTSASLGKNCNSSSAQGRDLDNGTISAFAPDGSGSSSACVDVYKPVLRVTKLPQSYIATVGNPVTFIVKIENLDSYAQAKSINLSEVLPSGWNYVSGSSYKVKNNGALPSNWGSPITNPTQTGQTLTYNLNETLSPTDDLGRTTGTNQDTLWIKFNAVPTNASPGCANKDTVTVTYQDNNNGSYTPVTDEANVCVCSPKLEMDKSAGLTEARVNEEVTFTLKVSNKNPVDAFNVNVQDYLPPGWVYVNGSGRYQRTNGSSPNTSNWTLLEPTISGDTLIFNTNITVEGTDDNGGATGTKLDTLFVEFKAKPTQNATVGLNVNRAIAEGKDAGNNPIGSNEDDAQVTVRKPEISITKSVDKSAANVGDTLTYTITITNSGNLDLINATITDTLPDGVTYLSGGSYSPPNIVTFTGLTIPQGSSISEQITVKINKNVENGSILINKVRVDGSDSYGNTYSSGPATAQTQVNAPKLLITKSSTPNPVKAGENITYTITVTNSGSAPATNVVITDRVPQHTTFVSADSGGQNTGGIVTWNIATLDANSQITVHFVVKVDSPIADNTIIENTAIVNSNEQGPINSDKVINVVSSVPQLVLCKSDSQDPVKPGNQFTYTIRYANNSTMNVTNVVIADTLPSGITYISANPTPTSVNGQIITWNIGNLPAGSSGNITLTVQVDQSVPNGTKVTNTVIATSNETPQAPATEDTLIGTLPNLTISKSDSVDPVQAGSQFTYTIRYQNTGGQDATNVVITDTLPNGLTFISAMPAPTSVNGQTLTWNIGTLQSGSSGQIIITVGVPIDTPNGTIFTNTATITSTETNPVTTSETTTVESKPVLTISKDVQTTHNPAQPGDIATYTITYGNTGNLTATNTFIVDAIPQNTRFIVGSVTAPSGVTVQYSSDNGATWTYTPVAGSDGTDPNVTHIKWTIGNLNPGVINQQVTFQVKINSPLPNGTVISNTASIDSDQTSPVNASKNFVVGSAPSIHITKTSDKNSVQAGDTLTYTIDYYNDGNMDATGVVITETYDPNVDFVSATPAPDAGTNNVWTIRTPLPADGTHRTIKITVKVKSPLPNGTTIHNIVTIDSDQTDPQQATKDVVVGSAPILTIVKTDTPDPVQAGDNLIYTITVGNTGNAPATNVVVTDTTPPHTTFVSARFVSRTGTITDPGIGNTGTVTFTLSGSLNQNEEFVVELIVKVDTPLDNNTTITNTAKVTSTEDLQGKESQTTTTVQSAPILSIDKVDTQDPVTAGSNITYRITVKNTGNMVAHNVIITDSTPQNTTFVSAQFIQGTGTITSPPQGGTGSITFAITSINKDETVIVELVVKTNSPLPNGTQITNTASVKSDEIQTPLQDAETTTIGSAPVLNISKTSSPNPVSAGDNITYTITVTNNGNMDATQFVITDSTPSNTTFVSARFVSGAKGTITSPPVGGTGTITWNPTPATLPVNATVVVELVVKTNSPLPSGTIITNTAFADSAETQQVSATNTTTVSGLPKLVITKSVYPTEQAPSGLVFYSITVTNTGNAAATNVTVTETYPSEVSFYYANPSPTTGNNTWVIPKLDAGASYTITIVVKVKENVPLTTPPVKVTNTASVTCAEIPAPQSASASFEVRAANFYDPAHVTQRKEVDPKGTVSPGTWLTYTNYFGNSGNAPAINVKIVDPVDSNLDETTLQISDGNLPGLGITVTHSYDPVRREITWTIPSLPPNTTGWVSFRAMARATLMGSTIITNTTRISADNAPEEVSTNTVYTYVVAPCPTTPTPPTPPTPPTAINLTFNVPDTICASSFSKFVLTFTGGTSPYEYEVDFGDGTLKVSGTEQGSFINLTHVYDKPGTYTVNIAVKDKAGKTATLTQSVTVKDCTPLPSVYHHNFIIGYPDKTVRPDRFVSRAEVAAMILRALGIDSTKLSDDILPFKDIPVTHWAYNFTRRIYQEGLMQGDSKGQFNPDKFATRAEIATILVRLGHIEPDYSDPLFSDIKKTDWFTPYVNAAVKAGLLTGYPDRTFRPNNSVTRAEFAAMLERILGREDIPQLKQFEGKENIIVWNDISPSHWAYYIMLEAWQPHIVTNVARAQGNITVKSKSIPVYITTKDSKVIIPKIGDTIRAIVPVDGIINGTDPAEREVFVKIINKEKP